MKPTLLSHFILFVLITSASELSCSGQTRNPNELRSASAASTSSQKRAARAHQEEERRSSAIEKGITPLMNAARSGDLVKLRELINAGADVNEKTYLGVTALMFAAERRQLESVKILLEKGAKPDPNPSSDEADQFSALIFALEPANGLVIAALLDAGAEPNPRGPGLTPLMRTIIFDLEPAIIELLIQKGANVNAKMPLNGYTSLMIAAEENKTQAVRLLIAAGADIEARNKFGETALSLAIKSQREEPIRLLREAGSKD